MTLPEGTTQQVLVPQLYVRVRPGDIDGSGALLSADTIRINSQGKGDLTNTGTIAGRSLVDIKADTINNLGGRISGGNVALDAKADLNNIGGSISADNAAVLKAGRDINIQSTTQSPGPGATNLDRVAGVYVNNPGGVLVAMAGRDMNLTGAEMTSAGALAIDAKRDINLRTVTTSSATTVMGEHVLGGAAQTREIGSVTQGNGDVQLTATRDINIRASGVQSTDGALLAIAGNDINITAGRATTDLALGTVDTSKSLLKKTTTSTFDSSRTSEVLSSSLSGKTVDLVAGRDLNSQAAHLRSDEGMNLTAVRDINLTTADQTSATAHARQSETKATGLANHIGMSMGPDQPTGAAMMGGKGSTETSTRSTSEAIGTTVSAGSLSTLSGRDTTLQGATVVAEGNVRMEATRNLTIESAQNSSTESGSQSNRETGMVGTWYNPAVGHVKGFEAGNASSTTQASSQVASLQGNVDLIAGENYRQTASSVLAAGNAGPLAGGDVNIRAKNVLINEAVNTEQSMRVGRSDSSILGGSAHFAGISTDTIQGAVSTVRQMGDTKDDRMQALGAANLAMGGKQVYDAAQSIASGNLSYGVSVNLSRNTSQSSSVTTGSQAVGSGVVGANDVTIVATGAGEDSNIRAVGSTITAGNKVKLVADNDVTLEAGRNSSVTAGKNSSHGENVGVTFGAGAQNGFSIQLGVTSGKGRDNQNDTSYNATHVSGGKEVEIVSGGDLTLKGAVVDGQKVKADVGGNLAIESLQDVSVGSSKQSSAGLNLSLCIPPICYGAVVTAGASASGAKADGVFISPAEQSGIKAGDGGFNVKVAGNTDLKGAVIESTQAALDDGKNSFKTGGTLTMTDLQNVSKSSGSSYSVSGSVSAGQSTAPDATTGATKPIEWSGSNSKPAGSAGVGSYSDNNQNSVTESGISGIAGDQGVRTGDATSSGTLVKDWNTQAIVKDVKASADITANFVSAYGPIAAKAATDWLNRMATPSIGESTPNAGDSTPIASHILRSDRQMRDGFTQLQSEPNLTTEERVFLSDFESIYANLGSLQAAIREAGTDPQALQDRLALPTDSIVGDNGQEGMQRPVMLLLPAPVQGVATGAGMSMAEALRRGGIAYDPETNTYTSASGGVMSNEALARRLEAISNPVFQNFGEIVRKAASYAGTTLLPGGKLITPPIFESGSTISPIGENKRDSTTSTPIAPALGPSNTGGSQIIDTPNTITSDGYGAGTKPAINPIAMSVDPRLPIPRPKIGANGIPIESNGKHTPGMPGYYTDAGTEPRNSLEICNHSVPTRGDPSVRLAVDAQGNVHRFFDDNTGVFHWSGSTGDDRAPLSIDKLRQAGYSRDLRNLGVK
ncbi:hemagglutinin repeat-containing protein [Variovorax robiniae]|uniref:Hemagglutinin repeat-containing protein n=1 Tax=Variovorax robiniae TaxID=1836199 RepID=A0ABU8XJD8_9BURK